MRFQFIFTNDISYSIIFIFVYIKLKKKQTNLLALFKDKINLMQKKTLHSRLDYK